MSSQAWAKAPDPGSRRPEENDRSDRSPHPDSRPRSSWQVWKQVIIGEILNALEGCRYDKTVVR